MDGPEETPKEKFVQTNSQAAPHPYDVAVGRRLRLARRVRRLSQGALGDGVGLSFQQVQKYERGVNRVSASTLAELAIFLEVPIDYFFADVEGLPASKAATDPFVEQLVSDPRALALVESWRSLPPAKRTCIAELLAAAAQIND
jgi:transcriptional regulator with XRE-family HTH domain